MGPLPAPYTSFAIPRMRIRSILTLAAPVALALAAGCTDAAPGGTGALPTLTEPGLYTVLTSRPAGDENQVTLSLRQPPGGVELASVLGEVQFDASALKLSRAIVAEGVEGEAFEVSPGRVRFVGTLVQGAAETPLLTLSFRGRTAREMFSVRIEEVTGGADLADVTAMVRPEPLFVQQR
jgi:hypothetical protein